MALIELQATLGGQADVTAQSGVRMSLSAVLLGKSSGSLSKKASAPQPPPVEAQKPGE
jgi:hypothetical protein